MGPGLLRILKQGLVIYVPRKYQGGVIGGASKPISAGSAIRSEATAVLEGLAWAKQMNFCSLIVETDSEELFKAVSGCVSSSSWEIYPLLGMIKNAQKDFMHFSWSLVRRNPNAIADWLAMQAKKGVDCENWVNRPPLSLVRLLRADGLSAPPLVSCSVS